MAGIARCYTTRTVFIAETGVRSVHCYCLLCSTEASTSNAAGGVVAVDAIGARSGSTLLAHGEFMSKCDLVLASQSPRRLEIVGMMGLAVSLKPCSSRL